MQKLAFIDESGNEDLRLSIPGVTSHYVVVALVLEQDEFQSAVEAFETIRKRFFQKGEIRSSSVSDDDNRRLQVLRELLKPQFVIYALVVDKARLKSPGLRYPPTFVKYLHGRLYGDVLADHPHVIIKADQLKGRAFTEDFNRFVTAKFQYGLFSQYDLEFCDSRQQVCLQAADLVAGTIARCYSGADWSPETDEFMRLMKDRLYCDVFPPIRRRYVRQIAGDETSNHDPEIEGHAYSLALSFIEQHSGKLDPDRQLQLACANALVRNYVAGDEWVSTPALLRELTEVVNETVSEQRLRGLVGKLRSAGLMIASRAQGGYKLPTSLADLHSFLNVQNSQVGPMLHRIQKTREQAIRATGVDILDQPEYANLKVALESSKGWLEKDETPTTPD